MREKQKSKNREKQYCVNPSTDIINENEAIRNLEWKFLVKCNDICHSIIFQTVCKIKKIKQFVFYIKKSLTI